MIYKVSESDFCSSMGLTLDVYKLEVIDSAHRTAFSLSSQFVLEPMIRSCRQLFKRAFFSLIFVDLASDPAHDCYSTQKLSP